MAVSAGYVTNQNKRWQEANQNNDTDLMNRLQADSKRAGYALDPYKSAMSNVQNNVSTPAAGATQPVSRTNQTIDRIGQLANANPFQYKAPEAFKYDQNSDPAYQAALASARANISQQQGDTNARLRAGGQGKSSYSESVANQIGAKEMGRVSTDVLPQLISQAYQRYSDQASRDLQVQQANYGAQQDQISNLGNLYGLQNQQDFQNPMAEAQLTGNYLSGEARQYIEAINSLKAKAETAGITREARAGLSQQADAYRAALQGLGVDPKLFGANVNATTASGNLNQAGVRTLAGHSQDYMQTADQRDFNEGVRQADRAYEYTAGRDKVQDAQWMKQFDEQVKQNGIGNALAWAQNAISKQNANTSAASAANSRNNAAQGQLMDIWKATGVAPPGINGVAAGTPYAQNAAQAQTAADYYSAIDNSIYLSPEYSAGKLPGQQGEKTGRTIVNDRNGLETYILSLELSPAETMKLYTRYGIPTK